MFELSVAKKYLSPRWKQLSVSIISLISILVIALVVWLIVVFFSVTNGLEKNWIQKLISLTAPIRVTPTEQYYNSYYYLIDNISSNSDYNPKSLREKLHSPVTNPYDEQIDEEPPVFFALPHLNADGSLKDIVKEAYATLENLNLKAEDFEVTAGNLRVKLLRNQAQSFISQAAYLGSYNPENQSLENTLIPLSTEDINNIFNMLGVHLREDDEVANTLEKEFQQKLHDFFAKVEITELKTTSGNLIIPPSLWPTSAHLDALKTLTPDGKEEILLTINKDSEKLIQEIYPLDGTIVENVKVHIHHGHLYVDGKSLLKTPLKFVGSLQFPVQLDQDSLLLAKKNQDLTFNVKFYLQGTLFQGSLPYRYLSIAKANVKAHFMGPDTESREAIYLPKTFKDAGVLAGDLTTISYYTPTLSAVQEQKIASYVAGFYDPGLIPLGGKFVLASPEVISTIKSGAEEQMPNSNGINVRFENLEESDMIKNQIKAAFKEVGIENYFKVETYKEYDFTKDILQQLQSDKTLFSLISAIIIVVACSNIISMLIIMVNDKKTEIGILRSMGTSSLSIAMIFGICGIVMGAMGSGLGTLAAYLTLKNMKVLINFLSAIQGHDAFNPLFFGDTLPSEISFEAMLFVIIATALISTVAGIVPAVKASMLRPSAILRSE